MAPVVLLVLLLHGAQRGAAHYSTVECLNVSVTVARTGANQATQPAVKQQEPQSPQPKQQQTAQDPVEPQQSVQPQQQQQQQLKQGQRLQQSATAAHAQTQSAQVPSPATKQQQQQQQMGRPQDNGARCSFTGICDHSSPHECGPDGLGCVALAAERRKHIFQAVNSSWQAYKRYAWGADQLSPLTQTGQLCPWVPYDEGMTLLSATDLLWLVGLSSEYNEARDWIQHHLNFSRNFQADTFTLSMTFLGSLLSLNDLTSDPMYLEKALDIANRTMMAFKASPTGWPWRNVNLLTGVPTGEATNVGEAASPTLEFAKLTQLTGDPKYKAAAYQLWQRLDEAQGPAKWDGLVALWWNVTSGEWQPGGNGTWMTTIGGMGDLAYEYMLKTWALSGGRDEVALRLYKTAMSGMRKHVLLYTKQGYAWLPAVYRNVDTGDVLHGAYMEHLACFIAGVLALGHMHGINTANHAGEVNDLKLGEQIAGTCYEFYRQSPSGLNSHAVDQLSGKLASATAGQAFYDQQPELIESLVYLWRLTGNQTYRDWGWQIFRAQQMWTRVSNGAYTGLANPTEPPLNKVDTMWEWWMAETLKYLWLLFSDSDVLPLDQWVFNTEAHPYRAQPWVSSTGAASAAKAKAKARTDSE